jgi:sulfopropanediol 3-dehydrogenase
MIATNGRRGMRTYVKKAKGVAVKENYGVEKVVREMLATIRSDGDEAVRKYALDLDGWKDAFLVSPDTIRHVESRLPETFKDDFAICKRQIQDFARRQLETMAELETEVSPGVTLGHKHIPVSRVGCYVPGGKYPLVSATIMSVGTARVAGVDHVIGCAPPRDRRRHLRSDALRFARGRRR